MKCKKCYAERLFLVRDVCEKCLPTLPTLDPIKTKKKYVSRKGCYVVRIISNWYYDGGRLRSDNCKFPARRGTKKAKLFTSIGPAKKVALKYGGQVEPI